ncbi:DUF4255 domain-containing protein [Candidatus Cardinium hertigii]|uniref:Pvc16 N-terminal domain-containing protein n=1 Tax=Candidatus Cardinium hertigii TaxID=247481 RepID=A0A2Z3L988_9BACT|nr:DUF4255 domain-containing protein [Candidatus Cardinium hertigii]AWN82113.1 hypothetical protein DK880_00808 [Candidatus Cardinium hertigii]
MLHHCTAVLLAELNRYIQAKLSIKEAAVVGAIVSNAAGEHKEAKPIRMRLVDIVPVELRSSPHEYVPQGDSFIVRKQPSAFSLYFLFSIAYKEVDLLKNLELLAYVAAFFQHKPYFDGCNTPILQQMGIENFSVELVRLTSTERSMLWSGLQLPYAPSLLYKVGLVFIEDTTMGTQIVSSFEILKR